MGVAFKFRIRVSKYSFLEKHHQIWHWLSSGGLYVKWNVQQGWGAILLYLDTENEISKTEPSAMPG